MGVLRNVRGDTIVEVLISIAIASFVIGGSYAVVNRSLRETQQAQEHSEALLIANTQIELIGHYIRIHDSTTLDQTLYSPSTKFHCFDPTTTKLEQLTRLSSLPDPFPSNYIDPAAPAGPGCDKTGTVDYRVAFEYDDSGTPAHVDDIYRVYVNWASIIAGSGDDQVKVVYKAGT